jgi:eukaryotic-like serine/threonine-protein kinase
MSRSRKQNFFKVHKKAILLNIALALLVLILAFWGTTVWMKKYTRFGEAIEVPDVYGMRIDKAVEMLESEKFLVEIVDSVYRPDLEKMDVADQDPKPGSMVKSGRKIYLTINSLGKPKVNAPRLKNVSFNLAKALIKNAGLRLGQVSTYKTTLGDGLVLEQFYRGDTLYPNTLIDKGAYIDLLININPQPGDSLDYRGFYVPPVDDAGDMTD